MDGALEFPGGVTVRRRDLESTLLAWPGVADFFVGQIDEGVEVALVGNGSYDRPRLRRELVDVLQKRSLTAPEVQVREVGAQPH